MKSFEEWKADAIQEDRYFGYGRIDRSPKAWRELYDIYCKHERIEQELLEKRSKLIVDVILNRNTCSNCAKLRGALKTLIEQLEVLDCLPVGLDEYGINVSAAEKILKETE